VSSFKLPKVNSTHGAPMGRPPWPQAGCPSHLDATQKQHFLEPACCFHIPLVDGGYDRGGAYWGTGTPLWCATNGFDDDNNTFQVFVRAHSRDAAIKLVEIQAYPNVLTWTRGPKVDKETE